MALCPFAEHRLDGINNGGQRSHPIIGATVHHMDGWWQGAESRFRDPSSDASAAFGFKLGGDIIQWLDTDLVDYHACMAQWEGWIGFENESDPATPDAPPTPQQIASMGRVISWLGISAVPAVTRTWGGIGYHGQFPGQCSQAWGQTGCPGRGFIDSIPTICAAAGGVTAQDTGPQIDWAAIVRFQEELDMKQFDVIKRGKGGAGGTLVDDPAHPEVFVAFGLDKSHVTIGVLQTMANEGRLAPLPAGRPTSTVAGVQVALYLEDYLEAFRTV